MAGKPMITDRWGRPMQRSVLKTEVAAATVGGVRTPTSGYPADGLTPVRLAQILRDADQGMPVEYLELAEFIEERDLHYLGVLGTRRRQVSQIEITVEPADDSEEAMRHAELVEDWLDRDELADEIFDTLDAIGKGFSFTEIIWDTSMGQWNPSRLELRDPRWFRFHRDDLRTPMMLDEGGQEIPLPAFKFIFCQIKAKSGLPLRSGLARAASFAYMFKKYTERDWAIFSQTYGQPLRLGKFGPGASEEDKNTLFRAVTNIAGDCAGIIPQSMEIDFVETGNLSATGQLYKDRCDFIDRQISKAVLGQTATTDADTGGLGSGEEHGNVRQDIETADAKALSAVLNRDLIRPWIDLEFGPQRKYPRLRIARPENEDLKMFADAVAPFIDRGLPVTQQSILDKFGLSGAENDDAKLFPMGQAQSDTPPSTETGPFNTRLTGQEREVGPAGVVTPDLNATAPVAQKSPLGMPREIAAQLAAASESAVGDTFARLEAMMETAGSLEELRELFLSAYPDIKGGNLVEMLADAMTMADAAGRISIAEDEGNA